MATQKQKEKRRQRVVTAEEVVKGHEGRGSNCLDLPRGLSVFAPKKPQTYELEFIPYTVGEGHPRMKPGAYYLERKYIAHRTLGAGDTARAYCCLKNFGANKKCPVCAYRDRLALDPKADEEVIKALKPKTRQLFLVWNREEKGRGVQLFDVSTFLFGDFLVDKLKNARPRDREAYNNFYDPVDGMTVLLTGREKTMGKGKPFLEFYGIEFRPREEPIPDEILDHGYCLDTMLKEYEFDELRKIFFDVEVDDGEEGDDDGGGGHTAVSRNGRADPAEVEEEEPEEEEAEDEGEEEEEEPPTFTKGDKVTFEYKKKDRTGTFLKLNKAGLAVIDVDYQDDPAIMDVSDLTAAEEDEEPEEEETEPEEEEEEEEEPAPKKGKPAPAKGGKKKATPVDDDDDWGGDDDEPFDGEEAEEESEDEEPPKRPGKKPGGKKPRG